MPHRTRGLFSMSTSLDWGLLLKVRSDWPPGSTKVTEMGGLFTEMLKQIAGSLFLQSVKVIAAILLPSLTAVAMVSLMPLASETW